MSEQLGTFWCRVTDRSPWWNRGEMTRAEALAAAEEAFKPEREVKVDNGKVTVKINPNGGYGFVTVTTPSPDPPNKLPTEVLGGDKDGLYGPWAPPSDADPFIVGALSDGARKIKAIADALKDAEHPGGKMTRKVLRSHLRRLGYKRVPKDKDHGSERWGR